MEELQTFIFERNILHPSEKTSGNVVVTSGEQHMCKTRTSGGAVTDLLQIAAELLRLRKLRTLRNSFIRIYHNFTLDICQLILYKEIQVLNCMCLLIEMTKDWK